MKEPLDKKISKSVEDIVLSSREYPDDERIAFFACVAMDLWALNLAHFKPEMHDKILSEFAKKVKERLDQMSRHNDEKLH